MICNQIFKIICPCFFISRSSNINSHQHQDQEARLQDIYKKIQLPDLYQEKKQQNIISRNSLKDKTKYNANSNTTTQQQNKHQYKSLFKQEQFILPKIDYKVYANKQNPYFQIISIQLSKLNSIFDIQAESIHPQTPYNLHLKIAQSQDKKTNIFSYSFQLPTSYQYYEHIQNNFQLQKIFDVNIENYDCLQEINEQTKIIYLSYKRVLIIAPRDFIYIRYTFKHQNQYWSIATSKPDAETYQGKCRGDIILTATRVIPTNNGIKVNVYSQVDMKISIKGDMAKNRGVQQIKKYLDKTYKHINQHAASLLDNDLNI